MPSGTAFRAEAGVGLPDNRALDCPYCGAPLEPLRWRDLALAVAVLAFVLAARKLAAPFLAFLDWRILAAACVVVLAYHAREVVRWRRARKERHGRDE